MALDGSKVRSNPGTLIYTPSGGGAQSIGFTAEGVRLLVRHRNEPIVPEELGDLPLDYIFLSGPILVIGKAWQWDAATRNALAKHAIDGTGLMIDTQHIGRKASDLALGTLLFTPQVAGHVKIAAKRAVPLLSEGQPVEIEFRKRRVIEWAFSFAILPPDAGGKVLSIGEDASLDDFESPP